MKQSYDWKRNILDFTDINGNRFYLKFKGDKTIVSGKSASGKTLLCTRLKKLIDDKNINMKPYGADNIFIMTQDNTEKLSNQKNKLIIIDRAEQLLTESIVEFINQDFNNRYLIFLRKSVGIELSPNHFAELYNDGDNTIKIKYDFDVKGWC